MHDQAGFIPRSKNGSAQSVKVMHHLIRMKDKNHMITFKNEEKAFGIIQDSFVIKTLIH